MKLKLIILAAGALAAGALAQTAAPDRGLEGLWAAREHYGPDIRGTLILHRRGGELRAHIAGFSVAVREEGQRLSFSLPDGKGSFRGVRGRDGIRGQWFQGATRYRGRYATPLFLRADGRDQWRGEVVPLDDTLTFFLPIAREPSGTLTAFLLNPERNVGLTTPQLRVESGSDTVRLLGRRRGAEADEVVAEGRRDREADALRLLLSGSSFDFARADGEASSPFFPRGRPGERYRYRPPVARDDGWPVATLEEVGISREAIERFVQSLIDSPMENVGSSQIHSVLIARRGRLVLEEYFHGHDRDTPHDTRSASKSWVAVLVGAAMQAGVPIRLDMPVYETMLGSVPADLDPRKRAMTLEHLVSMTSGFDCDESNPNSPGHENAMQTQTEEPDWYRFTLNLPMASAPGERIAYCAVNPNLAGGMVERVAGEPQPELFERLVARPLQMGPYHLQLTPTGTAYGGGGHYFRPRDYLKLAQLMVNGGRWNGRQIVSRDWARRSTAALRILGRRTGQTYGWLWNSLAYPYRGRTVHAFFAGGNGGQIFMGIPELDLVIGFTGGNYGDRASFIPQQVFVPERILPAVN